MDKVSIGLSMINGESLAGFKIKRMKGEEIFVTNSDYDFLEIAELWAYRGMKHAGLVKFSISDLFAGPIGRYAIMINARKWRCIACRYSVMAGEWKCQYKGYTEEVEALDECPYPFPDIKSIGW